MMKGSPIHSLTYFTGTTDIRDQSNWQYLIHKYIPNIDEQRILDVGCASGFLIQELAKTSKFAVGIDVRPLDTAPGYPFIQADCHDLPFKDHSFDLVLSLGVLEHVSDYELAITEMKRVLKPGGYLFLMMGPTPLWKYLDNPEHRKTITKHPEVSTVLHLLQDGYVRKIWNENIEYRLFHMDTFQLFPTNPILAKLFRSCILRDFLSSILRFFEKNNMEQNICLIYHTIQG